MKHLKTIASTGSPLSKDNFRFIYKNIKKDVHLTSISGGTDIVSCFVLGNPNKNVYAGEIQSKGLGMDVDVFDENGNSLLNQKGEMVCKSSFPSKPIYFWKDKNNYLYKKAYFNKYNNIWNHGDFAEITKNKGIIIYGRSDTTLNSGGVRIGTAEIYRTIENINEISESLITEKNIESDTIIVMFVSLRKKYNLTNNLKNKIKLNIKKSLSPRHVPKIIIEVSDIPKTRSGKIVELMIKDIINNKKIYNIDSLSNPECLKDYYNRKEFKN